MNSNFTLTACVVVSAKLDLLLRDFTVFQTFSFPLKRRKKHLFLSGIPVSNVTLSILNVPLLIGTLISVYIGSNWSEYLFITNLLSMIKQFLHLSVHFKA